MKANELSNKDLQIGDWVYITEHPMRKEAKQVKPEHFIRSLVTFEPIQLTPEILEKNGFENQGFRHHDEYNGIDDRVVLRNKRECIKSDNEWILYVNSEDYSTIARCELTYLHELQHILRLCKIDKEIVV